MSEDDLELGVQGYTIIPRIASDIEAPRFKNIQGRRLILGHMAAVASKSEAWVQGYDKNGRPYWRHNITRTITYYRPTLTAPRTDKGMASKDSSVKLSNRSPFPSSETSAKRSEAPAREADQWSVHKDHRKRTYYINCVTRARQYEKPDCFKKYSAK